MFILRFFTITIFITAIPIFIVTTNVRWVINAPILYSYGFDKYQTTITAWTGIERTEYLSAAKQIRDYFNNTDDTLDVRITQRGILKNIYNNREISHMKDVKNLIKGVYLTQLLTGSYILAFMVLGIVLERRKSLPRIGFGLAIGSSITIGLIILTGIGTLAGFDNLFHTFHLVSFTNDLWILDPNQDNLIAMFPQGFFFDATIWILISSILEATLILIILFAIRRKSFVQKYVGNTLLKRSKIRNQR